MYIPIGSDMSIRDRSIIGIFDLENTSISKHTRKFLKQSQDNGEVITVTDELPKSFILSAEYGMNKVYLTQFHTKSLEKRL
ncbi:MAG: DUF370 domain-containing protein [Eubacteriales bacterium]